MKRQIFKGKTSHRLRVTGASSILNASLEEKHVKDRTGHRSNALIKFSELKSLEFSEVLAPKYSTSNEEISKETKDILLKW